MTKIILDGQQSKCRSTCEVRAKKLLENGTKMSLSPKIIPFSGSKLLFCQKTQKYLFLNS